MGKIFDINLIGSSVNSSGSDARTVPKVHTPPDWLRYMRFEGMGVPHYPTLVYALAFNEEPHDD